MRGFDIGIRDREGRPIAIVEVKRRRGTDLAWARRFYQSNIGSEPLPADFFLLVTVDTIYLWRRSDSVPEPAVIDAAPVLRRFFEKSGTDPSSISAEAFELLVFFWLGELSQNPPVKGEEQPLALRDLLTHLSTKDTSVAWAA